jgi:hypothetical protein
LQIVKINNINTVSHVNMDNTKQQLPTSGLTPSSHLAGSQLVRNSVSNFIKNKKRFILAIIGLIFIILLVRVGTYYLITKKDDLTNQPLSHKPVRPNRSDFKKSRIVQEPTVIVFPSPASGTWKTESIQIVKESSISGAENISLTFQLPSNWKLQTITKGSNPNNLIKNCADYVLTGSDITTRMTISPICTTWEATYSDWPQSVMPQGAKIINEEKNVGKDSHTTYTVRYLDPATSQYKYVEGEKGTINKIIDVIIIEYNPSTKAFLPIEVTFTYIGQDAGIFDVTDQIIATLKAQLLE